MGIEILQNIYLNRAEILLQFLRFLFHLHNEILISLLFLLLLLLSLLSNKFNIEIPKKKKRKMIVHLFEMNPRKICLCFLFYFSYIAIPCVRM